MRNHSPPSNASCGAQQTVMRTLLHLLSYKSCKSDGDVHGGLLFCAAFSKALRSTQAKFKSKGLHMHAHYDDVCMLAPPQFMEQTRTFFAAELRKINLVLRPSASAVYSPGSVSLPATLLADIPDRSRQQGTDRLWHTCRHRRLRQGGNAEGDGQAQQTTRADKENDRCSMPMHPPQVLHMPEPESLGEDCQTRPHARSSRRTR